VDKIGVAPAAEVVKGHVWSFTVEPLAHAIAPDSIIATASSQSPDMGGPEKTADGSGLNDIDQHDAVDAHMWTSGLGQQPPVWIQYEFDNVHKLHEMWSGTRIVHLSGWPTGV